MSERRFQDGQTLKDIITDFEGICVGFCQYITGCNQYLVQPKSKKKSEREDAIWLDEDRLEQVGKKVVKLKTHTSPGPDKPAPVK